MITVFVNNQEFTLKIPRTSASDLIERFTDLKISDFQEYLGDHNRNYQLHHNGVCVMQHALHMTFLQDCDRVFILRRVWEIPKLSVRERD